MNISGRVLTTFLLVVLCANVSSGCTSMKRIHPVTDAGAAPFGPVKAGDSVALQLRDGRKEKLKVQSLEGENLVATTGQRYSRGDIVELKRKSTSPLKTTLLIAGIAMAAYFAFVLAIVTDDDFGRWT